MNLLKSKEVFNIDNRELRIGNLYKVTNASNNKQMIAMLSNITCEELTFLYPLDGIYTAIYNIHISQVKYHNVEVYKNFSEWFTDNQM